MTLISQTTRQRWSGRVRGSGSGSFKRRRRKRRLKAAGAALAIIAGVWTLSLLWSGGGADPAGAGGPALVARNGDTGASDSQSAAEPDSPDHANAPAPLARSGRESLLASLPILADQQQATKPRPSTQAPSESASSDPVSSLEMGAPPALSTPAPLSTVAASNAGATGQPARQFHAPGEAPADAAAPVQNLIAQAQSLAASNRPVDARAVYNRALHHAQATAADRHLIRQRMAALNDVLIFSPAVYEGDPFAERYTIRSGDTLSVIAHRLDLGVDWRFLQRVNRISDPRRIRVGQTIKVVRGPFHAIIDKSDYRLDLYAGASSDLMYVRSFRVGLGEHNQTPEGAWVVRPQSKLVNPHWVNPRTGQAYSADNPDNPIGERWIGLAGADETTASISGIGLHGTIEPETVGTDASMGCVRLLPDDVELAYELLVEGVSKVHIIP